MLRHGVKGLAGEREADPPAFGKLERDRRRLRIRERLLGRARGVKDLAAVLGREGGVVKLRLGEHRVAHRVVKVVAPEGGVAARGEHLEDAAREAQNRDVERSAPEVIDEVHALGAVVEAVGERRRGGLGEQPQDRQVRKARRVLRRLALRVVKVCGHRDDRARELSAKALLGARLERAQNLRAHLDRRLLPGRGADDDAARAVLDAVGQRRKVLQVRAAPSDEALGRIDRVLGIALGMRERIPARLDFAAGEVPHDGGKKPSALAVDEHLGSRGDHGGDERVRRAEINADGEAMLMRSGGESRLGDLKECHG